MSTPFRSRRGIEDRHGVASEVDKQLLGRPVRLPHCGRDGLAPIPVEVAESAVAVAVGVLGPVLLPQQQQRHGAPFQLLVDVGPIGQRPCRRLVECRWREEPPLQLGIVQSLRHRPGDADDGGTPQIFADCRSAHPNRDGDLPLANAKGVPQSQNFSNLPHRRSLGGHRTSPCMVAKEASSAIRSPTARASDRPHRVAGFNRNGWPTSVGIGGRIASESVADFRRITQPGIQHRLDQSAFIVARVGGRVSLSSILGSCSCAEFPGANRADPFRLGLGPRPLAPRPGRSCSSATPLRARVGNTRKGIRH